jgi:hypothetical protein
MKCNDVLLLLSEYNRGDLSPKVQQEVQLHLNQCEACAQEERIQRQLFQMLVQNPPELPQSLAFSMMPNRLWEDLQAKRKKRFAWFGFLGFVASAAVVALVFLWPSTPKEKPKHGLPELSQDEIAVVEDALSPENAPLNDLFEPIDISELDDDGAEALSQKIATVLPAKNDDNEPDEVEDGGYLEELDSLSPEELEKLDQLLEAQKKG